MPSIRGEKLKHQVNDDIDLDFSEAQPEGGASKRYGILRNFVRRGTPRWGAALDRRDTVENLTKKPVFTPDEIGCHSVMLIYFEGKGTDWRFVQYTTRDIHVTP